MHKAIAPIGSLLIAVAVAACATVPTPSPETSSGSVASMGSATVTPSASSVAAPAPNAPTVTSNAPDFTTYVSAQGFYISLPVSAWIGANETAPVTAFEDPAKDRVFIATAAYDDPTTPAVDRIPTTVDVLRGPNASWVPHWTMDVTDIADDAALDTWVKNHYGPGCSVEERAPTVQPGVEDVFIATDGLPIDTSRCVLNFAYEIRYQPSKQRVLSWELGQAPRFSAGTGTDEIYDLVMRDSVRMSD
jgi:hypothetical protein